MIERQNSGSAVEHGGATPPTPFWQRGFLGTYGLLLCALVLTYIAGPFLAELHYGKGVADFMAVVVVLSAIYSVTGRKFHAWTLAGLALAVVVPQALDGHIEHIWTAVLANIASMAFLAYLLLLVLGDIFRTRAVTRDTLVGSICGYLLISAFFAAVYSTVVVLQPEAFIIDERLGLDGSRMHFQGEHFDVLLYFSIITLTTVGYGDIIPATTMARELVTAEAVLGQVYLTMIVARLVGMHLTANLGPRTDSGA